MEPKIKRKRGRPSLQEVAARRELGDSQEALSIRIPTLQPEIKQIPPDTVNSKWVNLSQPAQEQVRGLFKSAERAVYMRARDEEKKAEAQFAVETLLQGVERKLPRFPFPPDTRDAHFDYEKLLGSNRSIEAHLTPTIHSIELLREAIQQEEALLEVDKQRLDALENGERTREKEHDRVRKVHPLLQVSGDAGELEDDADGIGLVDNEEPGSLTLDDNVGWDMAPLIKRLQRQMIDLLEPLTYAHELDDAVSTTRAAVDDVLFRELTSSQHEKINASPVGTS